MDNQNNNDEVVVTSQEVPDWARNSEAAEASGPAQSFNAPPGPIRPWARVARGGYEVSSEGDARFSALNAKFAAGTRLGDVDISGRSIEDVYQNVIKRSGKGLPPTSDSLLYNPDLKTDQERQDFSYENGYLPLWSIWADQNPDLVATLARISAGRTLTDRFASTTVSQARALSEIIRGERAYFEEEDIAKISPSRSRVSERALRDYGVYTLGIGKRSIDEFRALIPEGVTMVVDTRHYTSNRFVPEYRASNLQTMFSSMGARYAWMRPLSGVPADKRRKEDADWQSVSESEEFRQSLHDIAAAVGRGEKVLLIGSDGNPEFGPRALLDAMELERETDIRVGHIDTTSRGPRVRSTEEVVKHVLGRSVIHNGDYLGVHFDEKRSVAALDEGTNLIRSVSGEDTEARIIAGNWNYSTPVEFLEDQSPRTSDRQEALRSAFTKANEAADHTVIFSSGDSDRDVRDQIGIAGYQGTRISLPRHREDYYDPERIEAAANRIRSRISKDLTWKMLYSNYVQVNPENLKIAVGGAHIARIANSYVEDAVPGEFGDAVRRARNGGSQEDYTGMKMDDISGINQDDVNYFITEVFRRLQSAPGEFGEDAELSAWKITGLISVGQSGAGEAATVAAQSLGLGATVIAPKDWRMTIDNETLRGMDVSDKAAFVNRFHLGYRNDVTLQNLQEQLEERDRRSMMRDDGMTGGLSDRQVVVLYRLGFGNNAINDMMEVAVANNLRIDGPADMTEFIQNCAEGYGITSLGFAEKERVRALFDASAKMSDEWNSVLDLVKQARQAFVANTSDSQTRIQDCWKQVSEIQDSWDMKARVQKMVDDISDAAKQLDAFYLRTKNEDVDNLRESLIMARDGWVDVLKRLDDATIGAPGEMEESVKEDRVTVVAETFSALSKEWEALSGRAMDIHIDGPSRQEDVIGEEQVKKAWEDVIATEKIWRENGVGYVTPMSPDYPQNLRDMNIEGEKRTTRPAVLWYKGDLSLLDKPSVAVAGSPVSTTESISAARYLGGRLADEDIVLIANMSPALRGASSAAMQEHTEKGGKTVAVTSEGIGDTESKDAQEAVVKRGGLVASPKAPGSPSAGDRAIKYTEIVTRSAGTVVSILDGAFRGDERANPASILTNLAKVTFGLVEASVIGTTAGVEKIQENNKKKEQEKQKEQEEEAQKIRDVKANMEGVKQIVETARNLHETAYLDTPAQDWKIQKPEEKAVDRQETLAEKPKDVRQENVRILKIGAEEIFFVPETQEKVRKAVLEKYPKALFADPSTEKGIVSRLRADEITLDGARISVHGEQRGASWLQPAPDLRTEFFFRDKLLRVDEVPNGAMGLSDRTTREDNVRWFDWMKYRAMEIRSDFMSAVGLQRKDADMRFDNANYVVIGRNSIELRRGDDITASIRLTDEGRIKVTNASRLTDDLSDHYDEEHYPALTTKVPGGAITETAARSLMDEFREAVMDRPHSETLALATMTREEQDERREKILNGFLNVRADNVSIAVDDLAEGVQLGNVSTAQDGEGVDRFRILAELMYEEKTAAKALDNRSNEQARQNKALAAIPAENEKEREEVERRIDELYQERAKEAARLARIKELKIKVVSAKSLLELSRQDNQITYCLDGGVIRLNQHRVSGKALLDAARELEKISADLDYNGYRSSAAMEIVSSIRAENEAKAAERQEKEQKKHEAEAALAAANKARREEIVKDFHNGVCVVAVTGGMAYADKDLNVISQPYHELTEMASSFGLAKNEKGQMKLIYPDGKEVNENWFDGISKPSEHICVVKTDKGYNHLNLADGQLVSKEWHPGIGNFHEGLSVVKNAEGKFNYIDTSGKPLLNNWVDRASDFKDGVANVIFNETKFEVDRNGNVLRNITQEQKMAAEKKQPGHQRTLGDS